MGTDTWEGEVHVDAAPDEIVLEHEPEVARHTFLLTLGAVMLFALLAWQIAWFYRNSFAQDPALRGYYEAACRLLGCELPVYSDPDALHATHLVVRTDPGAEGALAVDAVIRNDAPWRQRFPYLTLRFSDIQGKPVAARTFKPGEYLAGEMTGLKFIPSETEVRVSLEIVDPGPKATGYSLTVEKSAPGT